MAMTGINKNTGKHLTGLEHLRQSIIDILTTPLGTRVMRRHYGSKIFELIDAPLNADTLLRLYAAIAEALDKWEPRLKLEKMEIIEVAENGKATLSIQGLYFPDGVAVQLDGIIL